MRERGLPFVPATCAKRYSVSTFHRSASQIRYFLVLPVRFSMLAFPRPRDVNNVFITTTGDRVVLLWRSRMLDKPLFVGLNHAGYRQAMSIFGIYTIILFIVGQVCLGRVPTSARFSNSKLTICIEDECLGLYRCRSPPVFEYHADHRRGGV